jgi:hypothetical protein
VHEEEDGGGDEVAWTHMSGDEVGHEVERDPPPDGAEDVAGGVLRPAQDADGVVDLGQVLEQERHQQHGHDGGRRARAYHCRRRRPDDHLRPRVRKWSRRGWDGWVSCGGGAQYRSFGPHVPERSLKLALIDATRCWFASIALQATELSKRHGPRPSLQRRADQRNRLRTRADRCTLLGAELQRKAGPTWLVLGTVGSRAAICSAECHGEECEGACGRHGVEVWWYTRYNDEGSKILGCCKGFWTGVPICHYRPLLTEAVHAELFLCARADETSASKNARGS